MTSVTSISPKSNVQGGNSLFWSESTTFIYESFMLLSARLYEMTENRGGGAIISSGSFCADTACSARVSVDSFWVIHLRAQRCGVRLTGNCSFTATLLSRLNAKF